MLLHLRDQLVVRVGLEHLATGAMNGPHLRLGTLPLSRAPQRGQNLVTLISFFEQRFAIESREVLRKLVRLADRDTAFQPTPRREVIRPSFE